MKKLRDVLRFLVPVLKSEPPPSSTQETLEKGVEEILTLLHSHEKFSEFFITESGNESFLMSSSTSITFSPPPNSSNQITSGSSLMSVSSSRSFRAPQWNSDDVLKKVEERIPWCFLQVHTYIQSNLSILTTSGQLKWLTTLGCSLHQGVHNITVFVTSGCLLHQTVHYVRVFATSGCSLHQGVHHIRVFTTSGCSLYQGVHYIRLFTTSGCSLHQGVHYNRVFTTSGCLLHQGVRYIRVFTTSGCSPHQGVHHIRVFTTSGCSLHQGVHYIRVFTTSGFNYNRVDRCTL